MYNWQDKSILIAEDEEINYFYLSELLNITQASVYHARNGKEAVDYVKNGNPVDIILMDIRMPVMNGYEATEEIKKYQKNIPIIAQTAYALSEDRKKAFIAGCDEYLSKPITRDTLYTTISRYLSNLD